MSSVENIAWASLAPEPWSAESLKQLYSRRLFLDETKGVDRLAPHGLLDRIDDESALIARKVAACDYRFAPFAQVLRSKGANKPPREICIPTARDRLALLQLKERLHEEFPEHVGRKLPNTMVREALDALLQADPEAHVCLRLDIKDFYGSIAHDRLLSALRGRLPESEYLLVSRAIRNPAVPNGSRRSHVPRRRRESGVPQGLAISNILADIYLGDFDDAVAASSVACFRFVDDLFVIVEAEEAASVYSSIKARLESRGLAVHPLEPRTAKGGQFSIDERIEFLGYVFDGEEVTVRDSSVDRFIEKIAGRIARYRRERRRLVKEHEWMTPELAQRVLIEELNERITGAISESRRYGWMFYFSAMTDERLLFQMDRAIRASFSRLSGLRKEAEGLKRLARALHEVRHRPDGRYIHNYDQLRTMKQRLDFLVERGRLGPDQFVSEEQVNTLFEQYRRQQLSELEADVAFLS
jgi:hypothetical protein